MKSLGIKLLKLSIPVLLLGWLVNKEWEAIVRLIERPKHLPLMVASCLCLLTAVMLTFVRWYMLIRALEIPFRLREAIRLGFLGYLFNFVGPSAVGGDLFKAYFVAKEQTEKRAEVVATILLDRVVGFYSLLVVGTVAIQVADTSQMSELGPFLQGVSALCLIATCGLAILLFRNTITEMAISTMIGWPVVGGIVQRTKAALDLYRQRMSWLLAIGGISVLVHALVAVSIHLADRSIHATTPTLGEHLIISPLATVAAAAPVPGGLGTYEFAMDYLYARIPAAGVEQGQGLAVAVVYRVLTVGLAIIGGVFFFANRSGIRQAMSDMEAEHHSAPGEESCGKAP